MKITFITLFPEIFPTFLNFSILKRAQQKGLIEFEVINLRDFGQGVHKIVDDRPYGGGAGMVLKADVLAEALKSAKEGNNSKVLLTSASGKTFDQAKARQLSEGEDLVIICGHYEGVDQRFIDKYVDEEISIGDYVLTGGELPSLVIADSITRLIPGVLEKVDATINESFEQNLLEYPHYTRPEEFEGIKVPEVLLSGNHLEIEKWKQKQSEEKTLVQRPDLITKRV
jgi:tRNA (guanine37-N1)-methyltransferase